jgi:hypothetical protein
MFPLFLSPFRSVSNTPQPAHQISILSRTSRSSYASKSTPSHSLPATSTITPPWPLAPTSLSTPITSPELVFSWKTACIGLCGCITSKERRRSGELEKTKVQGAGAALSHMTTQQVPTITSIVLKTLTVLTTVASTFSSTSVSSTILATVTSAIINNGSSSTNLATAAFKSSSLSKNQVIALAVGLGLGVPSLLMSVYSCIRRRK